MPKLLQREIDRLQQDILALSARVEEAVRQAVKSFEAGDLKLAKKIIDSDVEIDRMEIDVEEECLKVLALHQPVAIDLRYIVAALKINNDLERIGDLAVNIAERTITLSKKKHREIPHDLSPMAAKTLAMLKSSIEALFKLDAGLADAVRASDDEIDEFNCRIYDYIRSKVAEKPDLFDGLLVFFGVARQLERIADHATNIAEDVIYMVRGEIVRHHDKRRGTI